VISAIPIRLRAGQFFGGVDRAIDVDDLLLRETLHKPGQVIPRHSHPAAHFCLGVEGTCTEHIHGTEISCVPGTAEFHPAGTEHASRWSSGGGRCFTVTIGAHWSARMAIDDRELAPRAGLLGPNARDLMSRLLRELRDPDACSATIIDGLTLTLIAVSARHNARTRNVAPPAWFATAEEYVRAHAFGRFRAAEGATVAGVHPVLLSRWFRRVHGVTVGEFVRQLRVDRAARLLATTRQPITQIALACGFVDHAHLTRVFRRTTHQTPSVYRRIRQGQG
jgi:AraC family transcriptional regulator